MKKIIFSIAFISFNLLAICQNATIKGSVIDAEENEELIGVNILLNTGNGVATNFNGEYTIDLEAGEYELTFRYVGYDSQKFIIKLTPGETKTLNVSLKAFSNQLDDVVISAGKFEQKLGDVAVSMAVIKPALIENKATRDAEAIIDQVPGVQVNENQVSIRGGSGWSYGAGSRVLLLVDGMPMLAGDANDVKWSAIPLENISQMEILKGASSVLYGSSALNGVISIRTKYPTDKPSTKLNISNGYYLKGYASQIGTSASGGDSLLARDDQTWWDGSRYYYQGNFTHLRKLGDNNELVVGGNFMQDQGYKSGTNDARYRINGGLKHFSKKHKGLSYGLNVNNNYNKGTLFFLWQNADSVLFPQADDTSTTLSDYQTSRIMIDPYISYLGSNGNTHNLKTRFFRTNNTNSTNQASASNFYYGEYQFHRRWTGIGLAMTTGAMISYTDVLSELYGNHTSNNIAAFIQGDQKWEKVTLSAGMRLEYFRIDTTFTQGTLVTLGDTLPFQPVFRLGATYNPFEYTFIRASYGQGYRFPSIAEKYVSTSVGALTIFPNPKIQAETGWSAELGIKQGFKIKNFQGYLDVSAFLTQYKNMMEFMFGAYHNGYSCGIDCSNGDPFVIVPGGPIPTGLNVGAQSINVENANIPGFEISVVGKGDLGKVDLNILAGYTYINPTSINPDSVYLTSFSNPELKTLKYRNKHMAKIDFQLDYKKIAFGLSTRYTSFMENVDLVFTIPLIGSTEIIPGYGDYRNARQTGDIVFDARFAINISKESKISFLVNNLLNREYSNRPGNVLAPRTIIAQYSFNF